MSFDPIKLKSIRPIRDHVLVRDMNFGERKLQYGLILPSDDGKSSGIRPRWAKVFAVGPEQKDIQEGQWILVAHGRWSRGTKVEIDGEEMTIRRVDSKDIMIASDEAPPADETISDAV
jgi:co-chaperonin GroES (HSP10)